MVRRTKEEAEQTRRQILQAARDCFRERGVGNTSLEHIAQAAGLTRGAIYWHFANKQELFKAMRDEAILPLVDQMDYTLLLDPDAEPLERVRHFLEQMIENLDGDSCLRSTMEIMNFKCEFVGEMQQDLMESVEASHDCLDKLQRTYAAAQRAGQLRPGLSPRLAALDTLMFMKGLLRLLLLGLQPLQSCREVQELIGAHIDSRRKSV